jgi:hypothetical protein
MPTYRFLFFRNHPDALTLDNPLDPMLREDCADIMEARNVAKAAASAIGAKFTAIEDDKGGIERWRLDDSEWRPLNA